MADAMEALVAKITRELLEQTGGAPAPAAPAGRFTAADYPLLEKHPEVVLCTGHGYAREVDAVVRKAVELGVKKICVNHPHFLVNATYEQMREWADMGAYIELNAAVFSTIAKSGTCPDEMAGKILETIPTEKIVLDSDLGQKVNVDPITGMLQFINLIADQFGVTEEQINLMGKETPSYLLGLK